MRNDDDDDHDDDECIAVWGSVNNSGGGGDGLQLIWMIAPTRKLGIARNKFEMFNLTAFDPSDRRCARACFGHCFTCFFGFDPLGPMAY